MTGRCTRSPGLRHYLSRAAYNPRTEKALRCPGPIAPPRTPRPPRPVPSSTSLFADNDLGRVGRSHSDDVIAGIDVMNLTRDAAREIAEEIHRGVADFLDRHAAPQRRIVLVPLENVAKVADPGRRQRPDRTRGDGVDADVLLAQISGKIAHGRLQRRFGDSHH